MYLAGEWSDFFVMFQGNVENLEVDACMLHPVIVKRCLAVPGPRLGWKVLGFET
jgi:hypothetical protein